MRIKRLELQGFKSFKDKTVVHFDHSITGIVGPNGCGKSNIVDAFFWVMGEQSYKHIRGNGSDDLIFNGSSKFTASAVAEGTLVMEIPDVEAGQDPIAAPAGASASAEGALPKIKMKEVSVTRRLHRGGEGEYFINGVQARLRDIQELFMDTGVGAKGYSIIEQGQIGKIVNSKPEDRRILVEEAAGIAKYKARKKETERKLEAASGNLARLQLIIAELEKNLGSLERQAEKARRYKEYKADLLRVEMTWGRRKFYGLNARLETEVGQKRVLEQDVELLRAQYSQSEGEAEVLRVAALDGARQVELLQEEVQKRSVEIVHAESAGELAQKRLADLGGQVRGLEEEREQLQAASGMDEAEVQKRRQAVAGSEDQDRKLQAVLSEIETQVQTVRSALRAAEQQFESAQREVFSLIERNSTRNNERAATEAKIAVCEQEIQAAGARLETSRAKAVEAGQEVTRVEGLILETQSKMEWLRGAIRDQETQIAEHRDLLKQAHRDLENQNQALQETQGKLTGLIAVDQAFEGVSSGSKAVLDWASTSPSGAGARFLLDLFEVTPGFEFALEGALEGRLQAVLFSDPSLLAEAQAHVKSQGVGRVCLVAADLVEASERPWTDVIAAVQGSGGEVLGPLADQVKVFAPGVLGVAAYQEIGRVFVVDQLPAPEHFAALTRALGDRMLVSLTGEVLEGNGTLRVGDPRFDGNHLILERKRQMRELELEVESQKKVLAEREVARDSAQKLFDFSKQTGEKLQDQHREYEIQLQSLEREKRVHERVAREVTGEIASAERALQGREASLIQLKNHLTGQIQALAGFDSEKRSLEERAEALRQAYEAAAQHALSEEERFQAERMQAVGQFEQTKSLSRELQSFEEMVRSRRERLRQITDLQARLRGDIERIEASQAGQVERIAELHREAGELGRRLAEHKNQQELARQKIEEFSDVAREVRQRLDEKMSIVADLAVRVEKAQGELNHLVQNLEEKYGVGCLQATDVVPEQTEMPAPVVTDEMTAEEEIQLGEEVERLRDRIRRLGEVNPMAAEEYDQLKQRFDSMAGEKADLERSIRDLQAAIEHINKTSEDRFAKAFEAIADRFERLFPVVFGGGQAKLSLVYPEGSTEILDAGIDILAQPPGKKIVNIGLLSGGEKALTAVALIFGIFLVKPSPFCILDEVDAPLDDANIGRFNALLKEMSARTQFIVVTHNKKTMELNDTLYGVTMEDPGVSKMVSIELH